MSDLLEMVIDENKPSITKAASVLDRKGWAEGNGGNFSIRISRSIESEGKSRKLPLPYPALSGQMLLSTTAGCRMRDVASDPYGNLCLASITENGQSCVLLSAGGKMTSEFPSHLAVHDRLISCRSLHKVFLHSHPTHIIALTHLVEDSFLIPDILSRMFPEAALVLSGKLASLPYLLPGSDELAKATAEAISTHPGIIWNGHGMAATGSSLASALDIIEVADKAANIALHLGHHMHDRGLTPSQVARIVQTFGV